MKTEKVRSSLVCRMQKAEGHVQPRLLKAATPHLRSWIGLVIPSAWSWVVSVRGRLCIGRKVYLGETDI